MNAPAKSYILGTKRHSGYFSCGQWHKKGKCLNIVLFSHQNTSFWLEPIIRSEIDLSQNII